MDSKIADDERSQFSERLKSSLTAIGLSIQPSDFARAFNARADGASVTVHAARKWLHGEAIPTHEKIVILSIWLGVNPAWLRFGEPDDEIFGAGVVPEANVSTPAMQLLNDIVSLPKPAQRILRSIVDAFLREYADQPAAEPKATRPQRGKAQD
ncbi:MAG: hypothetical protein ACJ8HI_15580 [Massilia sp.]